MWLILQIAAMTVAALSGIFDSRSSKQVGNHPRLYLAFFALVSLPVTVIGLLTQPFVLKAALIGLLSGLSFSAALLLYYRAISQESIVVLALPGRLVAAMALPLNALVFGESVSIIQIIVFSLLLIGGWMVVNRHRGSTCSLTPRLSRGFWLMVGVEILYVCQDLFKNMLAIEYDPYMMLTWERAGIVLGALLALIRQRERAEVCQTLKAMPTSWRLFLLCRPIMGILISLLAGLAVQSAGTTTIIVIANGAYPILLATLTWAIDRKWFSNKSSRKRNSNNVSRRNIIRPSLPEW